MRGTPCVVSVAEHAGWAHVIGVAADDGVPSVVARRRIALIEPGLPTQPYHHESLGMAEEDAQALIARVRRSVAIHTAAALQQLVNELAPTHTVVALAIREPPFPRLPARVAEVWASYPLQCSADGMMYQLAICQAARELGLDVQSFRRGDETSRAVQVLGVATGEVEEFITHTGRPAGPPWTQEHRRAYAAAIAAFAPYARKPLTLRADARIRA